MQVCSLSGSKVTRVQVQVVADQHHLEDLGGAGEFTFLIYYYRLFFFNYRNK